MKHMLKVLGQNILSFMENHIFYISVSTQPQALVSGIVLTNTF
jgi:ABC-type xylose transport system permease subunit